MLILWKKKEATVRNVYEALLINKENKYKYIPYTTVMSAMKRLEEKGVLKRTRLKNTDIYSSRISKKKLFKSIVRSVAETLL